MSWKKHFTTYETKFEYETILASTAPGNIEIGFEFANLNTGTWITISCSF